jgi:CBS domain-containing protein
MEEMELKAKDIMTKEVVTLNKEMGVKEVAQLLLEKDIGGAPVINEEGQVVGIVTEGDLIMEDVKLHFPTFIHLLSGIIYLESLKNFEEKLRKAVGVKVEDIMTKKVFTVDEEATLEDIATLMVEKGISRVPVLRQDRLVGIVTRRDIVKFLAKG